MIPEWLTISNNSGSGDSIVTITASSYNELTARTASLTVSGHTKSVNIGVLQEGTGVWSVSPDYLPETIQGGSIYLDIVSPYDNWYIVNNLSWITFNQLSGAPGSYSIEMTIDQNSNPYGRNGSFTVTDGNNTTEVTVEQDGTGEMSIYPTSFSFGTTGGTASFTVTAYTNWNVSVLPLWLHLSQETGATGVTVVTMTADTNSSSARSVTFEVDDLFTGINITVTQAENVLNVSPTAFTFVSSGEAKTFTVETYADYWEITNYPAWVSFSQTDGGPGIATVTVSAETNETDVLRTGTFNISDGVNIVTCSLSQNYVVPSIMINPQSLVFSSGATSAVLTITANTRWQVSGSTPNWCSFDQTSGMPGTAMINVTVNANNSGDIRDGEIVLTNISGSKKEIVYVLQYDDNSYDEYLTFTILTGGTIQWKNNGGAYRYIEYNVNNTGWTEIESDQSSPPTFNVEAGDVVKFRGTNNSYGVKISSSLYYSYFSGTSYFNASGNILSLVYGDNFVQHNNEITSQYIFLEMFYMSKVIDASHLVLPSSTVPSYGYDGFMSHSSLVYPPHLPALKLNTGCYYEMFEGAKIVNAPKLPARTMAQECYMGMFRNCNYLTTSPVLPAVELAVQCYAAMFAQCGSLNYITCYAHNSYAPLGPFDRPPVFQWTTNVSPTGTFVKSVDGAFVRGDNGMPEGWEVINV